MVAAISIPETSTVMKSGMSVGSASMLSWWVTCSITPPSLTPGASSAPSMWTATGAWIFSSRRTSSRSMCMTSPRTGWSCWSLTITGAVLPPPTFRSISAEPSTSTWRSTRGVDLERRAVAVGAAVDHAGHDARRGAAGARRGCRCSGRSSTAECGSLGVGHPARQCSGGRVPTYPHLRRGATRRQLDSGRTGPPDRGGGIGARHPGRALRRHPRRQPRALARGGRRGARQAAISRPRSGWSRRSGG